MANILMYTHNLDQVNGGVTFSLLERANELKNENKVHIITHGLLVNKQIKLEDIKTDNIYKLIPKTKKVKTEIPQIFFENEIIYQDKKNKNDYRVFVNGDYIQFRRYNNQNELIEVDFFNKSWIRTHKAFLKNKSIIRLVNMNVNNKPSVAKYIEKENCYMTIKMADWHEKMSYVHSTNEEINFQELRKQILKKYIIENDINTIIIDKRPDVKMFVEIKKELNNIKLIFWLHSNHYEDVKKPVQTNHTLTDVIDNLEQIDRIVTLTKTQKERLSKEWNCPEKIFVIPNKINVKGYTNKHQSRKNFVSFARYHHVKNIPDIIKAIKFVQKYHPDVTLDIFGYGDEFDKLNTLVANDLTINLNDFEMNVQKKMCEFSGFLLTSHHEGQSIATLEAYATKTPIFAYDIDFGPSDIITDYDNGILIKDKTPEELGKKIIAYINNNLNFTFETPYETKFSNKAFKKSVLEVVDFKND